MKTNKELKDEREMQEYYRKTIMDMVNNVHSVEYLKFLNSLMLSFKKKWGI